MNTLLAILLMATVTYLIRALPMVFIKKPITSTYIKSFLHYIPYTILAAMTVPYIFYATTHFVSALVGTLVALVLAWYKKNLIVVSLFAVAAAYVVEVFIG